MGSSNYQWAALLIERAGCGPVTSNKMANVARWMAAENPPLDWWHKDNPLNCGLNDGSTDGEGSYPSLDVAATETAQVLRQSNMAPIWVPLAQDAGLAAFSAGCAASAWSTGGYHGHPGYIASIPLPPNVNAPESFPDVNVSPPSPVPAPPLEPESMFAFENSAGRTVIVGKNVTSGNLQVVTSGEDGKVSNGWSLDDVTVAIRNAYPTTTVQLD